MESDDDVVYDSAKLLSSNSIHNNSTYNNHNKFSSNGACFYIFGLFLLCICAGLSLALPGPCLLALEVQNNAREDQIALLFTGRAVGGLGGALLARFISEFLPADCMAASAALLLATTNLAIPFSSHVWVLMPAFAVQGCAISFITTCCLLLLRNFSAGQYFHYRRLIYFALALGFFLAPLLASPFISSYEKNSTHISSRTLSPIVPKALPVHFNRRKRDNDFSYYFNVQKNHSTTTALLSSSAPSSSSSLLPTHSAAKTLGPATRLTTSALFSLSSSTTNSNVQQKPLVVARKPHVSGVGREPHLGNADGSNIGVKLRNNEENFRHAKNKGPLSVQLNLKSHQNISSVTSSTGHLAGEITTVKHSSIEVTVSSSFKHDATTIPQSLLDSSSSNRTDFMPETNNSFATNSPSFTPDTTTIPSSTSQMTTGLLLSTRETTRSLTSIPFSSSNPETSIPSSMAPLSSSDRKTTKHPTPVLLSNPQTIISSTTTHLSSSDRKTTKPPTTIIFSSSNHETTRPPLTIPLSSSREIINPTSTVVLSSLPHDSSTLTLTTEALSTPTLRGFDWIKWRSEHVLESVKTLVDQWYKRLNGLQLIFIIAALLCVFSSAMLLPLCCTRSESTRRTRRPDLSDSWDAEDEHVNLSLLQWVALCALLIFHIAYSGLEVILGGFLYTLAVRYFLWNSTRALLFLTTFWSSFTMGRLFCWSCNARDGRPLLILLIASLILGATGAFVFTVGQFLPGYGDIMFTPQEAVVRQPHWILWLCTSAIGFGCSNLIPSLTLWTEAQFAGILSRHASNVALAGGFIGEMFLPVLVACLMRSYSAHLLSYVVTCCAISCLVLFIVIFCVKHFGLQIRYRSVPLDVLRAAGGSEYFEASDDDTTAGSNSSLRLTELHKIDENGSRRRFLADDELGLE